MNSRLMNARLTNAIPTSARPTSARSTDTINSTNNILRTPYITRTNIDYYNQTNQANQGIRLVDQIQQHVGIIDERQLLNTYSNNVSTTENVSTTVNAPTSDIHADISHLSNLELRNLTPIADLIYPIEETYLSPVIIYPSREQINNAIERLYFEQVEDPVNYICPITREQFNDNQTIIQIKH